MTTINHQERQQRIDDIMKQHGMGKESLGTSIRRLRLEVTGFDQDTFAAMCKISTKALYQIEKDKGNPTINTIDAILRKFGLRMGITSVPKMSYTTTSEQHKPASTTPARGANPQRSSRLRSFRVLT
ncbi:MAG: helix-turn-helix transcriptional regulator [Pseudohongiellaceae bacterium]